jgi:predicted enzyme related to lactoylglutathione lyase
MSTINTVCWADIPVTNLDRAIRFYAAVLGQPVQKKAAPALPHRPPGFEFGLLPYAEDQVSGCLFETEENKPSEHGPLVYLNVAGRLDQAIQAVEKNGGQVLMEKRSMGPYGFRALIRDSEGNRIALHSPTA